MCPLPCPPSKKEEEAVKEEEKKSEDESDETAGKETEEELVLESLLMSVPRTEKSASHFFREDGGPLLHKTWGWVSLSSLTV